MNYHLARFYFRDARLPGDIFCTIVQALSQWKPASGKFEDFDVDRERCLNQVVSLRKELTVEEALHAACGMNDPDFMLHVGTTYRCWWDSENGMEERDSLLFFFAMGVDWEKTSRPDLRMGGQAEIFFHLAPYNELMAGTNPRQDEINQYVEKNLISMSDFMLNLAQKLDATSMKIFQGDMLQIPLNAHAAYYRDTQALQDDLRFIAEIWERGLPAYSLGAVKDGNPEDLERVIYRRDEKWKDRMMNALNALLPIRAMPTAEDVRAVLHSRRHDYCDINEGFAVLDYPFYMNSMLDRFYIDMLKQAAGMSLDSPP